MAKIKFLGRAGTQELINLFKADLALKQNLFQFTEMPSYIKYVGRTVQYVGETTSKYVKGHFYKSTGAAWIEVYSSLSAKTWELVNALPPLVDADWNTIYFVTDDKYHTAKGYIRGENQYYEVGSTASWDIVTDLPDWPDARPDMIYFVVQNDRLYGYIKNTDKTDEFYELGGDGVSNYNKLNNTPTINGIKTVNEEDPDSPKDVKLNMLHKGYDSEGVYDETGETIPVNEVELTALKDERIIEMFGG